MNKYHKIFIRSTVLPVPAERGSFAAYCAARTADCGYCGLRTCGTALVCMAKLLPVGVLSKPDLSQSRKRMYNSSSTDQSTDLTMSLLPLGFAAEFEIGVEI